MPDVLPRRLPPSFHRWPPSHNRRCLWLSVPVLPANFPPVEHPPETTMPMHLPSAVFPYSWCLRIHPPAYHPGYPRSADTLRLPAPELPMHFGFCNLPHNGMPPGLADVQRSGSHHASPSQPVWISPYFSHRQMLPTMSLSLLFHPAPANLFFPVHHHSDFSDTFPRGSFWQWLPALSVFLFCFQQKPPLRPQKAVPLRSVAAQDPPVSLRSLPLPRASTGREQK